MRSLKRHAFKVDHFLPLLLYHSFSLLPFGFWPFAFLLIAVPIIDFKVILALLVLG
jgi:hypothetical protein